MTCPTTCYGHDCMAYCLDPLTQNATMVHSYVVRKVWQFMKSGMNDCTKIKVGRAVLELDWNNKMKGLRLNMIHWQNMQIKSNVEMQAALKSFIKATEQAKDKMNVHSLTSLATRPSPSFHGNQKRDCGKTWKCWMHKI